jgi:dolichyl-diphosphooligosaccharide--protein glycosyltransferase
MAALTVIPVYFIGKTLFNRWAGVLAAGLIAVLPGEFIGRTIIGSNDTPWGEVLFSTTAVAFLILAIKTASQRELKFDHLIKHNWKVIVKPLVYSLLAGIILGCYLNTWVGGLLFAFIISLYLIIQFIINHMKGKSSEYLAIVSTIMFLVVLVLFVPFSPAKELTFAIVAAVFIPIILVAGSLLMSPKRLKPYYYPLALVVFAGVFIGVLHAVAPNILSTLWSEFRFVFLPSGSTATTTLEMQPFLSPSGSFTTSNAWGNFTTSFFLVPSWPIPGFAFISLAILIYIFIRRHSDEKTWLLLFLWTLVMLVATLVQRRFAYYLVVNMALLSGYLSWGIVHFFSSSKQEIAPGESEGGTYKQARNIGIISAIVIILAVCLIHTPLYIFIIAWVCGIAALLYGSWGWAKDKGKSDWWALWGLTIIGLLVIAFSEQKTGKSKAKIVKKAKPSLPIYALNVAVLIIVVFSLFFWTNINQSKVVASGAPFAPSDAWQESLTWMKDNTPSPMGADDTYYNLYNVPPGGQFKYPDSAYGVTSWWDYGYWITHIAHRIPSANPGQSAEPIVKVANLFLSRDDAKTQQLMAELGSSYLVIDFSTCTSKLWAIADWAGDNQTEYAGTYYYPYQNKLIPIQLYSVEYYQSLCVQLYNFDAKGSAVENPVVISYQDKVDKSGTQYRLIVDAQQFTSYQEALNYVKNKTTGNYAIGGNNPFVSPIVIQPAQDYKLIYSSKGTAQYSENGTVPEVKIFEYTK